MSETAGNGKRAPAAASPVRAAAWGAAAGFAAGLAGACAVSISNAYLSAGLHRLILFVAVQWTTAGLVAGAGSAALLALLYRLRRARGAPAGAALATAAAAALVVAPYLCFGYLLNRHALKSYWRAREVVFGLNLPDGLTDWRPLLLNGLATAAALLLVVALGRALAGPIGRLLDTRHARRPAGRPSPRRIAAAVAIAAVAGNVWMERELRKPGPGILLVSLDTLRADHLGCYGYRRDTSPTLDRLAGEGIRFARCVSQAPVTLPSTMSILTSLYPTVHGVTSSDQRLKRSRTTLAEILRNEGYSTAGFSDGGYVQGHFGFSQGFGTFRDRRSGIARIRKRAMEWMGRHRGRRFFCFIQCYDIHSPYDPPPPYDTMFREGDYAGSFRPDNATLVRYDKYYQGLADDVPAPLTEADLDYAVSLYDGGIRYTDNQIGILLDEMRGAGIYDNTLIVITSDHGEEFLEHERLLHSVLYYTVVHVPLLLKPPASAPWAGPARGLADETTVELIDIAPTILDGMGVRASVPMSGRSLLPLALHGRREGEATAFSEYLRGGGLLAITTPDYRYVATRDGALSELYRTPEDLREAQDRRTEEPEVAGELRSRLLDWLEGQETLRDESGGGSVETGGPGEETIEQLRALGYIE